MVQEPTPQKMGKAKKKKGDKGDKPGDKPGEWAAAGPLAADGVHTTLGTFEVRGRVYARAELQRREVITVNSMAMPVMTDISSLDLSVPTARVSLRYRAPAPWLTAEVEVDLAGRPEMKDGYVQAKWKHLQLRAGQFKMPVSSLEMASPWTLPFVRRGFMTDLLVDRLDIAGRRPGATVTLRGGGDIAPRLVLGAFQGSVVTEENADGTRKTELVEATSLRSQSLVARGQIEVAGMEIGAWYEHRVGTPAILMIDRYWTAGADLALDWVFGSGGLRIWADALAGASWFEHADKPADGDDATFVSARALVAYRFGGVEPESPYLEIYGLGGGLDPDADVVDDIALEAVLGVNVGLWRRARLSLQGEWNQAGRNFPASYYLGRNPDRIGLLLQAAVAF
jgi:hypothetical protein